MNKLALEFECPFDIVFHAMAETSLPLFKSLGVNANTITALSLITGLAASYYIMHDKYAIASVLWLLSYTLDCADGMFARKYNMTSKFGSYLDPASDTIKTSVLLVVLMSKVPMKYRVAYTSIFLLLFILSLAHLGCQEIISDKNKDPTFLSNFKQLCPMKYQQILKLFGPGTVAVVVNMFILHAGYINNKL